MHIVFSILLFITLVQAQGVSSQQALELQMFSPKFGVSFKPLGASLGIELTTLENTHEYTVSLVYNSVLNSHLRVQAVLRYDDEATTEQNLTWGLQLGSWEHDPHLQDTTETALGIRGDLTGKFKLGQEHLRFN